jgi:hypothetical protein
MMITQAHVIRLLARLGSDKDQVAKTLESLHVRGARFSYVRDPVANYLRKALGEYVEATELTIQWGPCGAAETIDTPASVRAFMSAFDCGDYGHLVSDKDEAKEGEALDERERELASGAV